MQCLNIYFSNFQEIFPHSLKLKIAYINTHPYACVYIHISVYINIYTHIYKYTYTDSLKFILIMQKVEKIFLKNFLFLDPTNPLPVIDSKENLHPYKTCTYMFTPGLIIVEKMETSIYQLMNS